MISTNQTASFLLKIVLLLSAVLVPVHESFAEKAAKATSEVLDLARVTEEVARIAQTASAVPLSIDFYIRGRGFLTAQLRPVQQEEAAALYYRFQGSLQGRGRAQEDETVTGLLKVTHEKSWRFDLRFSMTSPRGVKHFAVLRLRSDGLKRIRYIRAPEYVLRHKECPLHTRLHKARLSPEEISPIVEPTVSTPLSSASATLSLRELEVSVEYDRAYANDFGREAKTEIAAVMNHVDALYQRDLGIKLTVKRSIATTNKAHYPPTMTDANTLLDRFLTLNQRGRKLGSADAYLLFSGKDLRGGTLGLAFLGVVCAYPQASYALIQQVNEAVDHIIVSHEVAHLLNAYHDEDTACTGSSGIMSAFLGAPIPNHFSACTRQAIHDHIATVGSCLDVRLPLAPEPYLWGQRNSGSKKIVGGISLSSLHETCSVELRAHPRRKKVKEGLLLGSFPALEAPVYFEIPKVGSRLRSKRRTKTIHLGAVVRCDPVMEPNVSDNTLRMKLGQTRQRKRNFLMKQLHPSFF